MLFEILLALLLGVTAGTFTGLAPGIHINLVASFITLHLPALSFLNPLALASFIVSMSITHTFVDFIPSIFLSAPEEDNFLSILPGHRMLLEGRAHEAFVITLYGSLAALAIILLFTPLFILFLPTLFNSIKFLIPFILILISLYLIFREKNYTLSLITFLLAGFLGYLSFNLPVKEPLMPLLSGLFGLSSLIISLKSSPPLQKQKIPSLKEIKIEKRTFLKSLLAILLSSPLCSFLPGIGSGHASTIGSEIIPQSTKGFLFLTGATNTIVMGLSFVTLYAIGKTRSGSSAAISALLPNLSLGNLMILLAIILFSGIIAALISYNISKLFAKKLNSINYKYLTLFAISAIIIFNILFTNTFGILVLATSSALGIFTIKSGARRINMMGALIIPALIYYLAF